jgi:hypothetical protein
MTAPGIIQPGSVALLDATTASFPECPAHAHLVAVMPPGAAKRGGTFHPRVTILLPPGQTWPDRSGLELAGGELQRGVPIVVGFEDRRLAQRFARLVALEGRADA